MRKDAHAAVPAPSSIGGSKLKRMAHLQFDDVHLRRDDRPMPPDLAQMRPLILLYKLHFCRF
jgi:hypothetical protein